MALANENSYAIDPNELQADQQINMKQTLQPDQIISWTLASTSHFDQ